jgi:hypothetical protein
MAFRVNSICPGDIVTPFHARLQKGEGELEKTSRSIFA